MIAAQPDQEVLNYLLTLNIPINHRNFYGYTPLNSFAKAGQINHFESLLQNGADPNIMSYLNKAPIHFTVLQAHGLEMLLQYKAIIEILSNDNTSPLHTAVQQKSLNIVRILCKAGADPNFMDKHQRTSLHIAFNVADCSADASFELESLLLYHGADINKTDKRNRTPLHYAFVKINQHHDLSQIDPIETVSSACSRSNIDVNVQDQWQKTPLHYAAQRGALTSTMFMLSKGAILDIPDNEGNTPLGLAFKNGHANYAIMLIQKGADISPNVNVVDEDAKSKEGSGNQAGNQFRSQIRGGKGLGNRTNPAQSMYTGGLFGNPNPYGYNNQN